MKLILLFLLVYPFIGQTKISFLLEHPRAWPPGNPDRIDTFSIRASQAIRSASRSRASNALASIRCIPANG